MSGENKGDARGHENKGASPRVPRGFTGGATPRIEQLQDAASDVSDLPAPPEGRGGSSAKPDNE